MKVVILAGGLGTRLSEETEIKPKPMVEIGGKPILWHIMKIYSNYGYKDFVILLGYKGYLIKEYFANYFLHQSDVTIHTATNKLEIHNNGSEDWKITLVDTGLNTQTGGRILRAKKYIGDEPFFLTYGDGLSNINLKNALEFHQSHKKILTVTSVQPEGRFGALDIDAKEKVERFLEKPKGDGFWINAGYFICNNGIFNYLSDGDQTVLEKNPLEKLAKDGELFAFKHHDFWMCMDTARDRNLLNQLWDNNRARWKVWND